MHYNTTPTLSGHQMPLLMGISNPMPFEIEKTALTATYYDPCMQQTQFDMRTVGTYSLKSISTPVGRPVRPGSSSYTGGYRADKKNAIDDQKNVK